MFFGLGEVIAFRRSDGGGVVVGDEGVAELRRRSGHGYGCIIPAFAAEDVLCAHELEMLDGVGVGSAVFNAVSTEVKEAGRVVEASLLDIGVVLP